MPKSQSHIVQSLKTRRERFEHKEEAILEAAGQMFNSKGFAKTTIAEIARKSGIADGTVYLYFKNKDDLAQAVLTKFYQDLTQSAQDGVDALSDPRERIAFLARHHMERVIENWRLLEMMPQMDLNMDNYEGSGLYDLNRSYVAVFDRVAKNAMSQGCFRVKSSPSVLRDTFFGALEYGLRTLVFKNQKDGIDPFVSELMAMLLTETNETQADGDNQNLVARLETVVDRMEDLLSEQKSSEG